MERHKVRPGRCRSATPGRIRGRPGAAAAVTANGIVGLETKPACTRHESYDGAVRSGSVSVAGSTPADSRTPAGRHPRVFPLGWRPAPPSPTQRLPTRRPGRPRGGGGRNRPPLGDPPKRSAAKAKRLGRSKRRAGAEAPSRSSRTERRAGRGRVRDVGLRSDFVARIAPCCQPPRESCAWASGRCKLSKNSCEEIMPSELVSISWPRRRHGGKRRHSFQANRRGRGLGIIRWEGWLPGGARGPSCPSA